MKQEYDRNAKGDNIILIASECQNYINAKNALIERLKDFLIREDHHYFAQTNEHFSEEGLYSLLQENQSTSNILNLINLSKEDVLKELHSDKYFSNNLEPAIEH